MHLKGRVVNLGKNGFYDVVEVFGGGFYDFHGGREFLLCNCTVLRRALYAAGHHTTYLVTKSVSRILNA